MHHAPEIPEGPPPIEEGHEPSDVGIRGIRGIVIFGIVFVVVAVVVEVIMIGVMDVFKSEQTALNKTKPELFKDETGQFPLPQLQPNTTADMAEFRHSESQGLEGYSWVNEKEGIARIPIERALKIVADRGLPKAPPDPTPAPGSADPKKPVPPEASKK
jgi:hypothetical protein